MCTAYTEGCDLLHKNTLHLGIESKAIQRKENSSINRDNPKPETRDNQGTAVQSFSAALRTKHALIVNSAPREISPPKRMNSGHQRLDKKS